MPLEEFIAETMNILKSSPDATEICVERVKPLRFAECNGNYDGFFTRFNDSSGSSLALGRARMRERKAHRSSVAALSR